MADTNNISRNRLMWIALGGFTAVSVSLCLSLAGFAVGRATLLPDDPPEFDPVVQVATVEIVVTREFPVTVISELIVPTSPTPLATAVSVDSPSEESTPTQTNQTGIDLSLYDEVWDIIENDFDGDLPDGDDVIYSIIEGSIETLDDEHTRFIRPELAARLREDMDGSVSGIGAFVRENEEGFFEIIAPIAGQPAELAGLLPGDVVYTVDGDSVIGMSFDEIILLVRGPSGTSVDLTILREGEEEPLEFSIVRATFVVPVVESEMFPENIAYVRLLEFNQNADLKILEALDELLPQNPIGLILDLRNNPGGFLNQSISVADIFLPESVVLFERNRNGLDETFSADNGDIAETIPLVVLVNEASASASEIVAGAIQDNDRGTIIGTTTFGKGSVQIINTLSDGSELRVTIARWYTPDNKSISEEGITPDIIVETSTSIGDEEDDQLQRAVEYILGGQ